MQQAIRDFELAKQFLRPASIKRYRVIFEQLRLFCAACSIEYVDQFTPDHGTWLFNELVRPKRDPKGNTDRVLAPMPRTVNKYLQTIRALFNDEVARRHVAHNPMLHIRNLRVESDRPEYYTRDELRRFFSQRMPDAYRMAFIGLLYTGVRFSELANLRWEDVDLEAGTLSIRSRPIARIKTVRSERVLPMSPVLLKELPGMLTRRTSETFVFCSVNGVRMKESTLLSACKSIGARAGITSRLFLHKFRHTFATHMVQRKQPLEAIKELLGHASVRETEIYAHNTSDHLAQEIAALDDLLA